MRNVHISLFGTLEIQDSGGQRIEVQPRRAQELLCYLLLYRDHFYEREKLATLFWPDSSPAQSKRYLRQTLWQVQAALNHHTPPEKRLLLIDHERIGINPQAAYWLDIAVFDQAFLAAKDKPGRTLTESTVGLLRQAIQLYQGDLLEGWYQDWSIYERERYQGWYLALLDKLLGYSEAQEEYEAGLDYGEQILRYDRARERTHRQLMRLHYRAGNRTQAIHQYETCVTALREELNVGPDKRTTALYQQICNEPISTSAFNGVESAPIPAALENSEARILQQLAQIQTALRHLQNQVTCLMQSLAEQNTCPF
ncbi:MAG: BTAD domain-containing putative transcriptional regulator [Caldilineaceae bacterium]